MSDGRYDTAQVCMNGHVATSILESNPERGRKFCEECGEKTINKCTGCNFAIPGQYDSSCVDLRGPYEPPKHCGNCGNAHPWTARRMQALAEAVEEFEEMSREDAAKFKDSVADVVDDTPKTKLAAMRIKSLIDKLSIPHQSMFNDLLLKVVCEAAQGPLFG